MRVSDVGLYSPKGRSKGRLCISRVRTLCIHTGTETLLRAKDRMADGWCRRAGVLGITSKVCRAGAWVAKRTDGHSVPKAVRIIFYMLFVYES